MSLQIYACVFFIRMILQILSGNQNLRKLNIGKGERKKIWLSLKITDDAQVEFTTVGTKRLLIDCMGVNHVHYQI